MKRATPIILLLFTLSGVSGLIYELVWIRMLSHLLGGSSFAISAVLAVFMGGLALGSRYFGGRVDGHARPLRLYAWLEFGIAGLGLLAYFLILLATPAYEALAQHLPAQALLPLRVLMALLFLLPPTFCMGGTLPVLSSFVVNSRERLGRGIGLLYAVNTLGAVFGVFLTGFFFIASLGLAGSTALAIALNLLIGLVVLVFERRLSPPAVAGGRMEGDGGANGLADPVSGGAGSSIVGKAGVGKAGTAGSGAGIGDGADLHLRLLMLIFALSGFASLGFELYWTRALQHFLGNSTYAFSAMLTTFLLGHAAGGWLGGRLADRVRVQARVLAWVQMLICATALGTVYLIWSVLPALEGGAWLHSSTLSWPAYIFRRFLLAFAVMAPTTFLTGMTFPLVNRIGIRDMASLGRGVGDLYFVNTLGSILGSLAAGFLLLPLLGAKTGLVATACLSGAVGLVAHLGSRRRGVYEPWIAAALLLVFFGLGPRIAGLGGELLSDTQEPTDSVLFLRDDHAGETKVYRKQNGALHMSVDGHHIGGTEPTIQRKEKILAHLPMALLPEAKSSLSVGLGSAVTLGTLALYEELERIDCVEIVPGVVKGARLFSRDNHDVLSDPRVRVSVGDGIQFLLTSSERYDIISSDSKLNPEYSGNAPLLSLDYYELCRRRLSEQGVMVQWLSAHVPSEEMRMIARGFLAAFPHVAVYWYDPYNIILAGSPSPLVMDMDAVRAFSERPLLGEDLRGLQLDNPYLMASLQVAGRERLAANLAANQAANQDEGPVNTWTRPRLEFSLARQYRKKAHAYHEDDNLRWLRRLYDPEEIVLEGDYDDATLRAYRGATAHFIAGYAAGGGISHLDNGRDEFQAGLEINPDDERLKALLLLIDRVNEKMEAALQGGELDSAEELVMLGLRRIDKERYEDALMLFERAGALRPDDKEIRYNILLSLLRLGRMDDLKIRLDQFRADYPRDPRAHSLLGRYLARAQRFPEAEDAFKAAIELDPASYVHRNNLASVLARLGRFGEAGDGFAQVAELEPAYQNAAFFAAASYSKAGRYEDAASWMRFCLEQELATREQFKSSEFFTGLRDSEFWPTD